MARQSMWSRIVSEAKKAKHEWAINEFHRRCWAACEAVKDGRDATRDACSHAFDQFKKIKAMHGREVE